MAASFLFAVPILADGSRSLAQQSRQTMVEQRGSEPPHTPLKTQDPVCARADGEGVIPQTPAAFS